MKKDNVDRCALCWRPLDAVCFFSPEHGFICHRCEGRRRANRRKQKGTSHGSARMVSHPDVGRALPALHVHARAVERQNPGEHQHSDRRRSVHAR